jgi:hypothetical protein
MNSAEMLECAKENNCLNFLKYLWETTFEFTITNRKSDVRSSRSSESFKRKSFFTNNPPSRTPPFWLHDLIIYYKSINNQQSIKYICKWGYLDQDQELLTTLFQTNCFDQISVLIYNDMIYKWTFTKEQFKTVIEQSRLDLIVYFLNMRNCRIILDESSVQKVIVQQYMKFGHKMYYGSEMLVYIYKINWNNEYTKELCKNILRTIKTKDILNCHSPILTCLLLCEFLNEIMEISVLYRSLCDNVKNQLMQFCHNIQEANPDENYIKFLMTQKDSRGRTGLQIASENSFYHVLETPEIGIIVNKMWNGKVSNNGFFAPCSMHRYINNESKSTDPFNSFDTLDSSKVYFYQLDVWLSSCSLRYHPESLSTILLIVIYNIYIWMLVSRGQMMNSIYEMDVI